VAADLRALGEPVQLGGGRQTSTTDVRRRLVIAAWGALLLNVLPYYELPAVIALPSRIAQLVTQGALPLAFFLALLANPRVRLRPNVFLVLLSAAVVVPLMTSLHNEFFLGSTFRAVRVVVFVSVLWLLTPDWGRREGLLLRAHVLFLSLIMGSVLLGVAVSPGAAFSYGGRLSGAIWAMPPTQVAHYAAVLLGIAAVLWMSGIASGRWGATALIVCGGILLATQTRTALFALVLSLAVAAASLFLGHARVRRSLAAVVGAVVVGGLLFAPVVMQWLLRGQSQEEVSSLTGRSVVWNEIFALRRPVLETVFGAGMSNQSFDGLPIDSNWVAAYLDEGYFGIAVQLGLLLSVLVTAAFRRRSPARALALFLATYCFASSFTEIALSTPTVYLLDVAVAASLVMPAPGRRTP
jgi:hypothetical protein